MDDVIGIALTISFFMFFQCLCNCCLLQNIVKNELRIAKLEKPFQIVNPLQICIQDEDPVVHSN